MPPIHNVTVRRQNAGGTIICGGAAGNVNGNQIDITPQPGGGTTWISLPTFMDDYYISDGAQNWLTSCTTAPNNNAATGYFTVK
jgi:hypothetical protein